MQRDTKKYKEIQRYIKIYRDIQKIQRQTQQIQKQRRAYLSAVVELISLGGLNFKYLGGFSVAFKSNQAPTCVLYCQKGLISSLYLLFKVPSKKHSEICPALVISQS